MRQRSNTVSRRRRSINDAPIVFADPSKPNGLWTPQNDDGKFDGPMRLREAMVQSKNLVSVRLLDAIGVRYAREYVTRFGIPLDQIPDNLSMALGTASVSPLIMARGFAVFANGGFLVDPYFIDTINDRDGKEIYKAHPVVACRQCPDRLVEDARVAAAQAACRQSRTRQDHEPVADCHARRRRQPPALRRDPETSRISRRACSTHASPI